MTVLGCGRRVVCLLCGLAGRDMCWWVCCKLAKFLCNLEIVVVVIHMIWEPWNESFTGPFRIGNIAVVRLSRPHKEPWSLASLVQSRITFLASSSTPMAILFFFKYILDGRGELVGRRKLDPKRINALCLGCRDRGKAGGFGHEKLDGIRCSGGGVQVEELSTVA
jgi:hypothetical protein